MSKLTARKNALTRSQAAMTERLAAMRKEAGIDTREKRTLHMLCSATGNPFAVIFTRSDPGDQFQIERIDAESGGAAGVAGNLSEKPETKAQNFSAKEFDLTGFACPHCGHKGNGAVSNFFGCGCGKLQCGARIRVVDHTTHARCHDGCGLTGILDRRLESFSGDEGRVRQGFKSLAGPNRKRLTGPER